MNKPNISKGETIYVRNTDGKGRPSRMGKILEVVGRGAFVRFKEDPNKNHMVMWSKMGLKPEGPWGKKALMNGHKPVTKKRRRLTMSALTIQEAPKVAPAEKTSLSPMEKLASDLVGMVVELDKKSRADIMVTPELATRWLDKSQGKNRRKLKDGDVDKYQRSMKAGHWSSRTSDPIQVNREGYMVNGQHRFWAVALCGLTVEMQVIFGSTEHEEKLCTDVGGTRTAATSLGISSRLVAIVKAIRRHSTGNRTRVPPTNHEVENLYEHYKPHIEWFFNIPGTTQGKAVTRSGDIVAVILRARDCGESDDILTAFVQTLRRDPVSPGLEGFCNTDRIMMVNKLAQLLQTTKSGSSPARDERTSKVEWVLKRFLEDRPFKKIVANQEKMWPCLMLPS